MKTLSERLNMITGKSECGNAVTIDRRFDVNYYETLDMYCADNNIDLSNVEDGDFSSCAMWLEEYGSASPECYEFSFWIDEE